MQSDDASEKNPTPPWPIMADPAGVFEHRSQPQGPNSKGSEESGTPPRISLLQRVARMKDQAPKQEGPHNHDARQAAQDGPGEALDPKERDD